MSPETNLGSTSHGFEPHLPEINVVIAYGSARAALHAMRLLDRVVQKFRGEFWVHRNLWRFDVLALPEAFASALEEITRADLVVVAAEADADLPAAANAWLHAWGRSSSANGAALVALLESSLSASRDDCPARSFLSALARATKMEFFCSALTSDLDDEDLLSEDLAQRAEKTSLVLLGILERKDSAHLEHHCFY
jgi:hypothetical protein